MADPLDKNTIDMLAAAIDKAMNGQGGSRPYDQSNWGERRTPAQKAADMKKADQTQKSMIATMTKLRDGMKTQGKSIDQLAETLKTSTSSMKKSMDIFGHNFEKAEKEFVKALTKTLDVNKGMNAQLRVLAGKIEKMEDVFQFDELAKYLHDIHESIDRAEKHQTTAKETFDRLLKIQEHLDKEQLTFKDIDPVLKDFDKLMDELTDLKANGERTVKNDEQVGRVLQEWLKNNKISKEAQQRIKDLGLAGVAVAAEKSAKGLQYHASLTGAATAKLKKFAEQTFTAATALDLLIKAATKWYTSTKEAYGTGTEKGFGAVLARDFQAVTNGVNPDVLQKVQVQNAFARSRMGRSDFDKQTYAGVNEITGITGDRNEALKLNASLQTSLAKVNMDFSKMPGTIHTLSDSFLKLQYMTGISAEQFGQLNDEILGDGDTRRLMLGLQDKEKAAMIDSINKRIVENTQLGYSIDQTKEQIKLLNKLFDPLKPKNRFENSVKENVFLRTQGVNARDASAIANMDRSGGADKYKAQLVANGMSDKDAQAYVNRLSQLRANTAKGYQASLAQNNGRAFVNEALGEKLGMAGTYGSDAWLNGTKQTGAGQADFQASVGDFDKAVKNFAGTVLSMGDRVGALSGSIVGTVLKAVGIAVIAKQLGLIGTLGKLGKGLMTKKGFGEMLQGAKGMFGKGAGAASAAATVPEIELVNGIPRAKAAAEAATGAKGVFGALKGIQLAKAAGLSWKMLKGMKGGIGGLALMGAQDYLGDKSTVGKVLNSNAVNGAMLGATVGSFVPGIGTAIGAGVGGIGGAAMDAWDYFHQPNATPVAPTPSMPTSPTPPLPPLPVNMSDADFKKMSDQTFGKRGDPQQQTVEELQKQNELLTKILAELKGQSDSLNDNGNKSVDAMTKLQRALKQMGNGDSDLVAASKYN